MIRRSRSQHILFALVFALLGGFSGCSNPGEIPISAATGETASAYKTVSVLLTQTAAFTIEAPEPSTPGATPFTTLAPSSTPQPEESRQAVVATKPPPSESAASTLVPCDLAAAGNPIDVSVPDDSRMSPGESFVKTWRLVNAGSCTWSREYAVVYFSGMDMAARREDPFRTEVNPGESVEISLDMTAPLDPGSFQGNYKLRAKSGQLFGIGPEGGAPFWVRIAVVPPETFTPTVPMPTLTPTIAVFSSGSVFLSVDQSFDLDIVSLGPSEGDDLTLRMNAERPEWVPLNGARVVVHGAGVPAIEDCKSAETSSEPLVIGAELEGIYLCVRTDRGLPAWVYLADVDPTAPSINLQFVVWSVP